MKPYSRKSLWNQIPDNKKAGEATAINSHNFAHFLIALISHFQFSFYCSYQFFHSAHKCPISSPSVFSLPMSFVVSLPDTSPHRADIPPVFRSYILWWDWYQHVFLHIQEYPIRQISLSNGVPVVILSDSTSLYHCLTSNSASFGVKLAYGVVFKPRKASI